MNKIIEIMDYADCKTPITIENFENVMKISVKVVTGDEILTILYKDYTTREFDSSDCRMTDFFDNEYIIYDKTKKINLIDLWEKRNNSYDTDCI